MMSSLHEPSPIERESTAQWSAILSGVAIYILMLLLIAAWFFN